MKPELPALRAVRSPIPTPAAPRWRATAIALAAAAVVGLASPDAQALALGRITVQSHLGEPLRAEIDVPQISPDEVESLRTTLATPEVFRASGVDFNQALAGTQLSLQRRANGSYFLRLTGDRAITEPFVDVVVEANWENGRIVRDFTMLLDPPGFRTQATQIAPQVGPGTAAAVSPARGAAASTVAPQRAAPIATAPAAAPVIPAAPAGLAETARPRPVQPPAPAMPVPRAATAAPQPPAAPAEPKQQVTVQPGDTAGRIAAAHRPRTVSLDQMLVAMLRGNPEAFIGGDMNRIKAGAVLAVPSASEASAIPAAEARQIVIAHSRDFNEFRRRLAQNVTAPQQDGPSRTASGRVQAQVQDKAATAATPDRLTLSKGSVQGRTTGAERGSEEQIAKERAAQDTASRIAELSRNLAELNQLTAATGAKDGAATAAAPAPGVAPTLAVSTPAGLAAAQPAAPASAPAPGEASPAASAPASLASPAAPAAATKPAAPATESTSESGLLEQLVADPVLPAAAGGVLALLLGLGLYRIRRQRKANQVDSSFLESRLQPDSFFGASGGQRIDTAEAGTTGASSMVYSPSQLDAAGDVDPVAEADVYLAYGRDLQAEEILKEALRSSPERLAIHAKLVEIYARRRDMKAFELAAAEAHALTQGSGPEWNHICNLGQDLDPGNPLYRAGRGWGEAGHPPRQPQAAAAPTAPTAAAVGAVAAGGALGAAGLPLDSGHRTPSAGSQAGGTLDGRQDIATDDSSSSTTGLDLDLDFMRQAIAASAAAPAPAPAAMPDTAAEAPYAELPEIGAATASQAEPGPGSEPAISSDHVLEFDLDPADEAAADFSAPALPAASTPVPPLSQSVTMDLPDLELDLSGAGLSLAPDPVLDALAPRKPSSSALPDPTSTPAAAAPAFDPMAFNFDDLSLDLGALPGDGKAALESGSLHADADFGLSDDSYDATRGDGGEGADPLGTKLALAEEFSAIGDAEGARSLAEEVLAEASGELKSRAERFLAELG